MDSPQQREEQIFTAALKRSPAERSAFLDGACHGNLALRQRMDALLAAHEQHASSPGINDLGPGGTVKIQDGDIRDEAVGQTIGRYKLLERLGEGGCGVVYVAEQTEPVRRRVAVKVIKLGMDTKAVVARFEAERQALAMMDHPNIAKVLDAGTTETGRPFFVMELVRGIRITDYCDQAQLSTTDRLNLFIKVCQAIQHAHQKGIIHRDIKPSNILVTLHDGVPVPKVIDFGIAKATEGRLTDHTVYTQLHQFIGTPVYMSPEQAEMSGLDVDTRSDIYSLGVLLYELLAGSTPFDADELLAQGLDAMRRTIREKEPVRPSTRLATLQVEELTTTAKRRSADTHKLVHQLKGDLDWIVMKCLEKDRTRRYDTATGLALDLKRHLENEPVSARPPSIAYKLQKSFRRNKLAFVSALIVISALILGVFGATMGFLRSEKQRRVAESAQQQARENFDQARAAVRDILAVVGDDLNDKPGMQPLRVKLMRVAIERYQTFLKRSPADPTLRSELGRLHLMYGFAANEIGEDYTNVVLQAYDTALTIQRQLVKEQPTNRQYRFDLGWSLVFARIWHDTNGVATNQPEAISVFEGLLHDYPGDPFARQGLAWALGINMDWHLSDDPQMKPRSQRRLALLEQLVKDYPHSAEFRRDLANQLSLMTVREGVPDDSQIRLDWMIRGNKLRTENLAALEAKDPRALEPWPDPDSEEQIFHPTLLYAKFDLANGFRRQAGVLRDLKRWKEALEMNDRSVALWRDLVEQNPSVGRFRDVFLAAAFKNGIEIAEQAGDKAGAESRRRAAEEFWKSHPMAH